jgi:hypothetical protein
MPPSSIRQRDLHTVVARGLNTVRGGLHNAANWSAKTTC